MKKQHKEGTCKVSGRSVVFSAFYADFCLCPKLMIITTLSVTFYVYCLQLSLLELPKQHNQRMAARLLSTPMGVDYVIIGFDMEVQPLVTHNAT